MKLPSAKKTNGRRRRGRATSLLSVLTGKWGRQHRLPAHVTGEGDWEVEVPQIRMSRAFAVMLLLHIVAVGGLFAFRIWGKDEEAKENAETAAIPEAPAALTRPVPATPAAPEEPAPVEQETPPEAPAPEPQKTYVWHTGDTLPLVAARFGISGSALREANPGRELVPGTELVVPKAGRVIDGVDVARNSNRPSEFFNPLAAAEVRPPKAEVVPEPESSAGIPDALPPASNEIPEPVVVQKVSVIAGPAVKPAVKPAAKPALTKPVMVKTAPETPSKPKAKTLESPAQPARPAGQKAHVVSKGDTVFNIAKRYGLSAEDIAKANGLDSDFRIRMGQQLRIPVRR